MISKKLLLSTLKKILPFFLIFSVAVFLRFYLLEELPGEMFGDVNENFKDIAEIMSGKLAIFFPKNTGREGMLFYLTAIIARFLGLSYLTQKITTALIGLAGVLAIYFLGKELVDKKVGLLAAFFLAISRWHLTFSRLGLRAILMPLFVSLVFIFFLKSIRKLKLVDFLVTGLFLGLGMYTYTAFRVMPILILTGYFWAFWQKQRREKIFLLKGMAIVSLSFALVFAPLAIYAWKSPLSYWHHPARMINSQGKTLSDLIKVLLTNLVNQAAMLHLRGDIVFRVNPPRAPQLDLLSGLFFLLGGVYLFGKRQLWPFVLLPLIVLQLPSVLVLNFPIDIPSATRSIGALPFVCLIVALGASWSFRKISERKPLLAKLMFAWLFLMALALNFKSYFFDYTRGLPNGNVPFGKIIASRIDQLPESAEVFVYSCCWGEWGQPEPEAIKFSLRSPKEINFLKEGSFYCRSRKGNYYFALDPRGKDFLSQLELCFPGGIFKEVKSPEGKVIFWEYQNGF
ncbi:MAG TPA: glycosyltransferase family 39 protein [Patescibacteria group bacterium]|nr:glycosyltransferase family 39 protein [Patescibacteria group bacterium]